MSISLSAVVCYAMLCCGMLWYAMLCCGMMCYAVLCCGMLWYAVVCCSMLWMSQYEVCMVNTSLWTSLLFWWSIA